MIERKSFLQIVVLNTNLMKGGENDEEAKRQWDWLNTVLHKIHLSKKTVSEYKIFIICILYIIHLKIYEEWNLL